MAVLVHSLSLILYLVQTCVAPLTDRHLFPVLAGWKQHRRCHSNGGPPTLVHRSHQLRRVESISLSLTLTFTSIDLCLFLMDHFHFPYQHLSFNPARSCLRRFSLASNTDQLTLTQSRFFFQSVRFIIRKC